MKLNVIRGPAASGKTTRLRQLADEQGQQDQIIDATSQSLAAIKLRVRHLMKQGAKAVFINDCTEGQLEFIEAWTRRGLVPQEVQVHVVVAN